MKFAFSQNICLMRFFRSAKQTYADRFVINFYFSQPLAVFFADSAKTAFVLAFMFVLRILGVRNFTKVDKRIVSAVSVNMVNLIDWPFTINVKPRQTMCVMQNIVEPNTDVAMLHTAANNIAYSASSPRFSPRKYAGARIIVEQFMQSFWRHVVNINSALCGGQA